MLGDTRVLFDGTITITNGGNSSSLSPGTFTLGGVNGASSPTTLDNQGFSTGILNSAPFREIKMLVQLDTLAGGTAPTAVIHVGVVDSRKFIYQLDSFTAMSTQGSNASTSIGPGQATAASIADMLAFFWTLTGAPTTVTFYVRVVAKT